VFGQPGAKQQRSDTCAFVNSHGPPNRLELQLRINTQERNSNMADIEMKHAAGFLLAGAIMGAAVALLYAPQSGVRTKKDIKKFARKTADRLEDLQLDIRDSVADMAAAVKDGVDRGKKLGAAGYEQIVQGFDSAKQCVEEGRSRFEEMIKTA
jgi:gas vesicle protein